MVSHKSAECNRVFKDQTALREHTDDHCSVSSYRCTFWLCGLEFKTKEMTVAHVKVVHGCDQEKLDSFMDQYVRVPVTPKRNTHGCLACDAIFQTNNELDKHVSSHFVVKPFGCPDCDLRFVGKKSLREHYMNTHCRQQVYFCDICGESFRDSHTLGNHVSLQHVSAIIHSCMNCSAAFTSSYGLKLHQLVHVKADLSCPFCKTTVYDVNQHMKELAAVGFKLHKCMLCLKQFITKCALAVHERSHVIDEKLQTSVPVVHEKSHQRVPVIHEESQPSSLEVHENSEPSALVVHENTQPSFVAVQENSQPSVPVVHEKSKQSAPVVQENSQPSVPVVHEKSKQSAPVVHEKSHINGNVSVKATDQFSNRVKDNKGSETANSCHSCSVCGKKFRSQAGLNWHRRKHRLAKKKLVQESFKCQKCGKIFRHISAFSHHMKVGHYDTNCFQCDVCGKRFKTDVLLLGHQKYHLKAIEREKKTGHYKHKCNVCGMLWKDRCELQKHMISHSDERPFECDFCKKKYKTKSLLGHHIRNYCNGPQAPKALLLSKNIKSIPSSTESVPPTSSSSLAVSTVSASEVEDFTESQSSNVNVKPYACFRCPSRFTTKNKLNRHMKEKHVTVPLGDGQSGTKHTYEWDKCVLGYKQSAPIHTFEWPRLLDDNARLSDNAEPEKSITRYKSKARLKKKHVTVPPFDRSGIKFKVIKLAYEYPQVPDVDARFSGNADKQSTVTPRSDNDPVMPSSDLTAHPLPSARPESHENTDTAPTIRNVPSSSLPVLPPSSSVAKPVAKRYTVSLLSGLHVNKSFCCPKCPDTFRMKAGLTSHMKEKHQTAAPCDTPPEQSTTSTHEGQHEQEMNGMRAATPLRSSNNDINVAGSVIHLVPSPSPETPTCIDSNSVQMNCSTSEAVPSSASVSKDSLTYKFIVNLLSSTPCGVKRDGPHRCLECPEKFRLKENLTIHMRDKHVIGEPPDKLPESHTVVIGEEQHEQEPDMPSSDCFIVQPETTPKPDSELSIISCDSNPCSQPSPTPASCTSVNTTGVISNDPSSSLSHTTKDKAKLINSKGLAIPSSSLSRLSKGPAKVIRNNPSSSLSRITKDTGKVSRNNPSSSLSRLSKDTAKVVRSNLSSSLSRIGKDTAKVIRNNPASSLSRITKDTAKVVRNSASASQGRNSKDTAKVIWNKPSSSLSRISKDTAKVVRNNPSSLQSCISKNTEMPAVPVTAVERFDGNDKLHNSDAAKDSFTTLTDVFPPPCMDAAVSNIHTITPVVSTACADDNQDCVNYQMGDGGSQTGDDETSQIDTLDWNMDTDEPVAQSDSPTGHLDLVRGTTKSQTGDRQVDNRDTNDLDMQQDFRCRSCGKTFTGITKFQAHQAVHAKSKSRKCTNFKCLACGSIFKKKVELDKHIQCHFVVKPYKCLLCDIRFMEKPSLDQHYIREHCRETDFECDECGKLFRRESGLNNHISSKHKGAKLYACSECTEAFRSSYAQRSHMMVHLKADPFQCPFCKNVFKNRHNMKNHMKKMASKARESSDCGTCGKQFFSHCLLVKHGKCKVKKPSTQPQLSATSVRGVPKRLNINAGTSDSSSVQPSVTPQSDDDLNADPYNSVVLSQPDAACSYELNAEDASHHCNAQLPQGVTWDDISENSCNYLDIQPLQDIPGSHDGIGCSNSWNDSVIQPIPDITESSKCDMTNISDCPKDPAPTDYQSRDHKCCLQTKHDNLSDSELTSGNMEGKNIDSEQQLFKCYLCEEFFPSIDDVEQHLKSHEELFTV